MYDKKCPSVVIVAILSSLITGVIILSFGIYYLDKAMPGLPAPEPISLVLNESSSEEVIVTNVFNNVKDSVVHITSTKLERDFFTKLKQVEGIGSGVIISSDGYILTNDHVVLDADKITVTLSNGDVAKARLIGTDPSTDTAVLKIDVPYPLRPARLGDSSTVRPGQMAIAVGNPYGFDNTVTTGVVSAVNRTLMARNNYRISGIIQTDAAVNPGNSGGPLLNSRGEVIGINSAIFSVTGGFQGIGLAIPINTAKEIADQLIEKGTITRPWLGITGTDITPDFANVQNISFVEGVLLVDVVEGGPADKAGLSGTVHSDGPDPQLVQLGDIIIEMDGEKVKTIDEVVEIILKHKIKDRIMIKYIRNGEEKTTEVILGERPHS